MPSINRIRVNNVKYNFGTQQYDDFVMRMYGKNTLYDLANGGGKSVLMLLLLQNLIPNCTLDEKQPIEKLFRNGGGNTVIHSLVEWKLDEGDDKEGYRYMTTGFCARKAKDEADLKEDSGVAGKKDTASIEYFNYCILYRDYNKNDIVNLPLSSDGEKITFSGLRNYLRDLGRKDYNLTVHVFDRKGEYQRFISRYGLYESHWEIIRGINKTEGHVRTYFESNYKTTRKVVEDLLIEEIIEKAYLVKTEQSEESEDMAKNLLDIKDKLMELTKKKREIANYDRETELLHVLEGRVTSFLTLFEQRDKLKSTIANVYVTGKSVTEEDEHKLAEFERQKEAKLKQKDEKKKNLEALKIRKLEYDKEALIREIESLVKLVGENKAEYTELQNELQLKESMNEYMDYKKDAVAKQETEAVVKAATRNNNADISRLRELAYNRKVRDDKIKKSHEEELLKGKETLEGYRTIEAEKKELLHEAEVALEVAKSNRRRAKEETEEMLSSMGQLKQASGVLVLADAKELLARNEEEIANEEAIIRAVEEDKDAHVKYYYENYHEQDKLTLEVAEAKKELARLEEKLNLYLENADRIKNMMRIYNVDDQKNLLSAVNKRCMQCIVDVTNKKDELRRLAKKRAELSENRIIGEIPAVIKVKEYIETRHNEYAVSGMDYVAARTPAEREQLLSAFPLLPYGVVVKQFDFIKADTTIANLQLGDAAVPIFSEELLYNPMGRTEDDSVIFLSRGKEHFVDEALLKKELANCDSEIKELEETVKRLTELGITYEEDMEYISSLGSEVSMDTMDAMNKQKALYIDLEKKLENVKAACHDLMLAINQDDEALQNEKEKLEKLHQDEKRLVEVKVLSDRMTKLEEAEKQYAEEENRLLEKTELLKKEFSDAAISCMNLEGRLDAITKELSDMETEWKAFYQDYYTEGDYVIMEMSDESLAAEFKAAKAVYEKENIALADKKKLIETLEKSMQRAKRSIEKRGISMEDLAKMDEERRMYYVKESVINKLSQQVAELSTSGAVLQNQLEGKRGAMYHLDGNIEQSIKQLEERFGSYVSVDISAAEVQQAIADGDQILRAIDKEYKEMEKAYQKAVKQHNSMVDLYKDVKRIMLVNEISTQNAVVIHESEAEMRRLFEESLLAFDKSEKSLEKAKSELLKYKSHTAETLYSMEAFELSETIGRDVAVPEDYESATLLLENLKAMVEFIELEKERVTKGIQDMEFIKSSFESQCIQRCKDVKSELDKLPKLSRIVIDGELVQMVGLTIPYVKEDFIKQRMSDYIDDVVAGADKFDDVKDRMKYIRSRLVLKKLFSVIVTDMNAIKLTLYKRERIKEQSRYLRYEEAVGSTGQSQGIYIQFLISIINYISGMYGANVENDSRRKTIFIDNPFGAAKDIYIWEPIFALLSLNRVQLIVPARGATPAITARFDVNYILGQQMVNGKQQTVVVDYRSQIEQEEIEYKELDYQQASFDFI